MKNLSEVLLLGKCDKGKVPKGINEKANFLQPYHKDILSGKYRKSRFKLERINGEENVWRPFKEILGTSIQELQQFLKKAGFFPNGEIDGIYGYRTRAAARLFQEYIRTVEGKIEIGEPDGKIGRNTLKYILEWQQKNEENFVCEWGKPLGVADSEDYQHWMQLLKKGKEYFLENANVLLDYTQKFPKASDTLAVKDWNINSDAIHLIGIRREQQHWFDVSSKNKDLFVLLIKGLVFYFWGSTVSAPKKSNKDVPAPFLAEGQHLYRFGWHGISSATRVYQALRPNDKGVLVFRCANWSKGHIDENELKLDKTPNTTINIHWSGIGRTNFSAGCQVIAGARYINHREDFVDCRDFAASGTAALGTKINNKTQTRGAYNVLSDLILTYAPPGLTTVNYTLARDSFAYLSDKLTGEILTEMVNKLSTGVK